MPDCPEYRIRLFMSVDLVGSTAFKAKHADRREENEPYPIWLNRTRSFYRQFPQILSEHYQGFLGITAHSEDFKDRCPRVWKTVGDEIIFCVRLTCMEHLSCCIRSFVKALSSYGSSINDQEKELDVKGCAWIASFPAPNATILSASGASSDELRNNVGAQLGEEDELKADISPREYDFLGKQIDTGFRISKFAQSDELAISIDLAWMLSSLKHQELVDCQFSYKGRETLKGVIGGTPYPIITIQTERSAQRRELNALEKSLTDAAFAEPVSLRNYLHSFMKIHNVEFPALAMHEASISAEELPKCYKDLKSAWSATAIEEIERYKSQEEAGTFADMGPQPISSAADIENIDEINLAIDQLVKDYWSKGY